MGAQWSTTSGQYIIGWALCAKSAMAVHPPGQKPSNTMSRRIANPQGREALMSHPHQCNCQLEVDEATSPKQEPGWRI